MRRRHSSTILFAALAGVAVVALILLSRVRPRLLSPPAPALRPDVPLPGDAPSSLIAAPITVPLAVLARELEHALPRHYGTLSRRHAVPHRAHSRVAFELWRGPLDVSFRGDNAAIAATVRYALRVWYDPPLLPEISGACGEPGDDSDPRLRVRVTGPVTVDRDWRLRAHARFTGLRPLSTSDRDRCSVTFLGIDVTDQVVEGTRSYLERHASVVDSAAAHVKLRGHFAGWWATLQQPVRLADSLWLVMRPESVARGAVKGLGDSVQIALALRARPIVVMGPRPHPRVTPLPPLDTGSVHPTLDVQVNALAGYAAASRFLQRELRGDTVVEMGRTVRLDSLRVFGIGGGRVALEVRVSGDVAARLFLTGTPHVDPRTGRISVPDLDFDVHTRDLVLTALSWLREGHLRTVLRTRARWPGADVLGWVRARLEEGLNRDLSKDLRVRGQVESVRILGAVATRDALVVRASARGSAALSVVQRQR